MTEMLKGTLEGIVLAHLAVQPAYGYEITAQLSNSSTTSSISGKKERSRHGRQVDRDPHRVA
jgi:hypothetical protein